MRFRPALESLDERAVPDAGGGLDVPGVDPGGVVVVGGATDITSFDYDVSGRTVNFTVNYVNAPAGETLTVKLYDMTDPAAPVQVGSASTYPASGSFTQHGMMGGMGYGKTYRLTAVISNGGADGSAATPVFACNPPTFSNAGSSLWTDNGVTAVDFWVDYTGAGNGAFMTVELVEFDDGYVDGTVVEIEYSGAATGTFHGLHSGYKYQVQFKIDGWYVGYATAWFTVP